MSEITKRIEISNPRMIWVDCLIIGRHVIPNKLSKIRLRKNQHFLIESIMAVSHFDLPQGAGVLITVDGCKFKFSEGPYPLALITSIIKEENAIEFPRPIESMALTPNFLCAKGAIVELSLVGISTPVYFALSGWYVEIEGEK